VNRRPEAPNDRRPAQSTHSLTLSTHSIINRSDRANRQDAHGCVHCLRRGQSAYERVRCSYGQTVGTWRPFQLHACSSTCSTSALPRSGKRDLGLGEETTTGVPCHSCPPSLLWSCSWAHPVPCGSIKSHVKNVHGLQVVAAVVTYWAAYLCLLVLCQKSVGKTCWRWSCIIFSGMVPVEKSEPDACIYMHAMAMLSSDLIW